MYIHIVHTVVIVMYPNHILLSTYCTCTYVDYMGIPDEVHQHAAGYKEWIVEVVLDKLSLESVLGQGASLREGTQD